MGESWDDVYWETDGQVREWYVEYIAVVNEQKYHQRFFMAKICKMFRGYFKRLGTHTDHLIESI